MVILPCGEKLNSCGRGAVNTTVTQALWCLTQLMASAV
jgi:hypothetical protein